MGTQSNAARVRVQLPVGPVDVEVGPDVNLESEVVLDSSGARVDQAYVDRAVTAAVAGRPSLSGPGRHSPNVTVRLPEQLHDRARAAAAEQGRPLSAVLRDALEAYLS